MCRKKRSQDRTGGKGVVCVGKGSGTDMEEGGGIGKRGGGGRGAEELKCPWEGKKIFTEDYMQSSIKLSASIMYMIKSKELSVNRF